VYGLVEDEFGSALQDVQVSLEGDFKFLIQQQMLWVNSPLLMLFPTKLMSFLPG